jgi:signal transduction histidine kinase/ActR/RegA family two-component response regulator
MLTGVTPRAPSRSRRVGYATALLVASAGLLVRIPLDQWIGEASPVLLGCLAASLSARIAGRRSGAIAVGLSLLPDLVPGIVAGIPAPDGPTYLRSALVLLAGLLLSAMTDRSHRPETEQRIAGYQRELESHREAEAGLRTQIQYLEQSLGARNAFVRKRETAWQHDQRRRRESELLAEVAHHIHRLHDVERMLHPVAAAVRDLTAADSVFVAFREPGGFRVHHTVGSPEHGSDLGELWPDTGPIGFVGATGAVFRTTDVRTDPRLSNKPEEFGLPADIGPLMVAPMRIGGSTEGVIIATRRADPSFEQHDEEVLGRVAQVGEIAIRNARLLAGEQSARAEAEATSRAKDEFLAMLGHELRNPLGAMTSAVTGFERIGEQWNQLQQILGRQTRHLGRLLDDLLDVSRLTQGKISLHRRPLDLRLAVENLLTGLRHEGRVGGHRVRFTGDSVWVNADPTRLEQVIRNLLDNALKYTPSGGEIDVYVAAEASEAVLRVRDTGIGIAPEILPQIFDPFVQHARRLDRPGGGLGLGLTVVRRLVELHGGRVSVYSGGRDQGSEFVVRLPVAPALDVSAGEIPSAPPAVARARRCRVAVVEDYADAREALEAVLTFDGHEVEVASEGPAGLQLVLNCRPDLALIDIGLPGIDGSELARRARAAPGSSDLYLVALTGYGQPYDRARALEAGFDDHLVKPLDPDALDRVLARAAGTRRRSESL